MARKPIALAIAATLALVVPSGCASWHDQRPGPPDYTSFPYDSNTSFGAPSTDVGTGSLNWLQNAALHDWNFR
jgi:hypothetical protein